jgi:hypothetical protein
LTPDADITDAPIANLDMGRLGVNPQALSDILTRQRSAPLAIDRVTAHLKTAGALLAPAPGFDWVFTDAWWRPRLSRWRKAGPRLAANTANKRRVAR